MLSPLLADAWKTLKLNEEVVGDIVIGNCLQMGSGHISSRLAQALGHISLKVPLHVINRQCSSGLQAVATVFNAINSGE